MDILKTLQEELQIGYKQVEAQKSNWTLRTTCQYQENTRHYTLCIKSSNPLGIY